METGKLLDRPPHPHTLRTLRIATKRRAFANIIEHTPGKRDAPQFLFDQVAVGSFALGEKKAIVLLRARDDTMQRRGGFATGNPCGRLAQMRC
jgi:hypothetical protein